MILTYSNPRFKEAILEGRKIHTIREDKNQRWKPGKSIQHWLYSPRNVSKNPHQFAEGECMGVQRIWINRVKIIWHETLSPMPLTSGLVVQIEERLLHESEIAQLAKNDDLTVAEFRNWFVPPDLPSFKGHIIHFTDKLY